MRFKVIADMEVQTSEGSTTLKEGQIIKLSKEEAMPLIQDGLIQPIEKVAYRIYSEILQAYLLVVDTDEDMHSLRFQGVSEAIYTPAEIWKLKGMDAEGLKAVHMVKEIFENSKVEKVNLVN